MLNVEIKSFCLKGDYLELYEDSEGKDLASGIPLWMLNQIIEKYLSIKVKPCEKGEQE